jgi:hypothetical protein
VTVTVDADLMELRCNSIERVQGFEIIVGKTFMSVTPVQTSSGALMEVLRTDLKSLHPLYAARAKKNGGP